MIDREWTSQIEHEFAHDDKARRSLLESVRHSTSKSRCHRSLNSNVGSLRRSIASMGDGHGER